MKQAPEGFRDVQAEESTGVRLDREALSDGVVVQYRGTRKFPSRDDRPTTVHIFLSRAGQQGAKRFSVFGSAQLDSKLANVKAGSTLWMLYAGKAPLDGQPTHVWQVSDAGLRLDEKRLRELVANSAKEQDALDRAIATAEATNAGPRGNASAPSPEYTDADAAAAGAR